MINWLTAIFGFLAAYSAAALVYVLTRHGGYSPGAPLMLGAMIAVCIIAALINEARARRAKRRAASSSVSPKS